MTADVVTFHGLPESVDVGDGVTLRRIRRDDVPAVVNTVNNTLDTLAPWMECAQEPATVERQLEWFTEADKAWDAGTGFNYCVEDDTGALIGGVGYHVRNGPGVLEIGYWLGSAYEGRGIMTRCAEAMTRIAAQVEGVHRIEIHCDPDNVRSAAIPQRLGYRYAEEREAEKMAPAQTGKMQIWVIDAAEVSRDG
jgi:RimJ/RimL family protein N-acetyltransferase